MNVAILSGHDVIGFGELKHFDPPMGVAFGPFMPAPAYNSSLHAAVVDGQQNAEAASANLTARGTRGAIECAGVGIDDAQDTEGEIEVTLFGITEFPTHFGDHCGE